MPDETDTSPGSAANAEAVPEDEATEEPVGAEDEAAGDAGAGVDGPGRHLLLFRKSRFWQVEREEGHWRKVGRPIFRQIEMLAACDGLAYVVEDGTLLRVRPATGHWGIVGRKYDYLNATCLAGHRGVLYAVHHTRLWRIDPSDGSYEWIGKHRDWEGEVRIVGAGEHLIMLERERLFITETEGGQWRSLSDYYTYVDCTDMCSDGERVYALVRGQLLEIRPEDGANRVITGHIWRGNALMAADERFVYIINRHRLAKVDITNGDGYWLSDPLDWMHVSHMVLV